MIAQSFLPLPVPSVSVLLITPRCLKNSALKLFFGNEPFTLSIPKTASVPDIRKPSCVVRHNNCFRRFFTRSFAETEIVQRFCVFGDKTRIQAFVEFAKTEILPKRAGFFASIPLGLAASSPLCLTFFKDACLPGTPINVRVCQPSLDTLLKRQM